MAYTYPNNPVLSKVKIGTQVYYLKDADVRDIIDGYGDIVTANKTTSVANDAATIPTSKAVYDYVAEKIADLASALIFRGVSTTDPTGGTVTINGSVLTPDKGDVVIYGTKEYVYDDTKWVELGDEGIYLTQATAEADYVKKVFTIAGINMQDNITADELKKALNLKALAYLDNVSSTGSVDDYATGIIGVDYTPAGTVNVALTYDTTATVDSSGSYTPAGTVSITQATTKFVAGVAPSVNETKSAFATAGVTVDIGSGDNAETLVFTTADTAQALTSTGFNQGTLPSLSTAEGAVGTVLMTGISKSDFTGTAGTVEVSGTYAKAQIDAANTNFSGTKATITPTLDKGDKTINVSTNNTPTTTE